MQSSAFRDDVQSKLDIAHRGRAESGDRSHDGDLCRKIGDEWAITVVADRPGLACTIPQGRPLDFTEADEAGKTTMPPVPEN